MYTGKEHWLGLDNIFKLTNRKYMKTQLKIILESYSGRVVSYPHTKAGRTAIVTYDDFHLKDQVMCTTFTYCKMNITIFTRPLVTFSYIIFISDLL